MMIRAFVMAAMVLSPLAAQAQDLTPDQLIQLATDNGVCGDRSVASAQYETTGSGRVIVTCGEATGFVPAFAGLGLAGAAGTAGVLAALAAGGGNGSTPDTQ